MDTRVRLSIIIPMYNAEKYIAKCLDSIFAEIDKTDDIEVILIDDGSSDRSIESCKDFLVYNIQILKNIHKGVSAARNLGIAQATGKWIMFVDADDWLAQGWSSVLSAYYADSADIVFFNKDIVEKMDKNDLMFNLLGIETKLKFLAGPFSKLYRKSTLTEGSCYFNQSVINGEDMLFNAQFLINCRSIRLSSESIYCYRIHTGSSTKRFDENIITSDYTFHELLKKILEKANLSTREKKKIQEFCVRNSIFILTKKYAYVNSYREIREYFRIFKQEPYCKISVKRIKSKKDIIIFLVKLRMYMLAFLICRIQKEYKFYHDKEYIVRI